MQRRNAKVSPELWARYLAHRAKGYPVRSFEIHPKKAPFTFKDATCRVRNHSEHCKEARWTNSAGLRFRARFLSDEFSPAHPMEFLGKFVDDGDFPDTLNRKHAGRHEPKRFRPYNSIRERAADYHAAGWAKGPAYAQAVEDAKEDMERAEAFGNRWWSCGMVVDLFAPGKEDEDLDEDKGFGTGAIWGIESDCNEDYLIVLAQDCAAEALQDAKQSAERAIRRGELAMHMLHLLNAS